MLDGCQRGMGAGGIPLQHLVRGGRLHHHDGDRVGDDVVQLTRDAGALGGHRLRSRRAFAGCGLECRPGGLGLRSQPSGHDAGHERAAEDEPGEQEVG